MSAIDCILCKKKQALVILSLFVLYGFICSLASEHQEHDERETQYETASMYDDEGRSSERLKVKLKTGLNHLNVIMIY